MWGVKVEQDLPSRLRCPHGATVSTHLTHGASLLEDDLQRGDFGEGVDMSIARCTVPMGYITTW